MPDLKERGLVVDTIDGCGAIAHDERVMPDGRPVFAWHYELERLREENAQLRQGDEYKMLRNLQEVLGIVRWVIETRPGDLSTHLHVRFRDVDMVRAHSWRDFADTAQIIPEPEPIAATPPVGETEQS